MHLHSHLDGPTATLRLEGLFTFDVHRSYKTVVQELIEQPGIRRLVLDLSGVQHMDSSSLGMLLLTREKAAARGIAVALARPSPNARMILDLVHFERVFEIVP